METVDVRLLTEIEPLMQQLDQTQLDDHIGISTLLSRASQQPLQATINWSTHINSLGDITVDPNSQLLARLGRVGGKFDGMYLERVAGKPYTTPFSSMTAPLNM